MFYYAIMLSNLKILYLLSIFVISCQHIDCLKFYLVTYNVARKELKHPKTIPLLFDLADHQDIDVYAVTFQELPIWGWRIPVLQASNWEKQCEAFLLSKGYILLMRQSMQATSLQVFVRARATEFLNVTKEWVLIRGKSFLKGATIIGFSWRQLSFTIVGSHLSAGMKEVKKRNDNYRYIVEKSKTPILDSE